MAYTKNQRARVQAERREKRGEIIAKAQRVEHDVAKLNLADKSDRAKIAEMANDWMKADPARMRRDARKPIR